jgi:hypothetical protein
MRLALTLLSVCNLISGVPPQGHSCGPGPPSRGLVWGHDHVLVDISKTPLKSIKGVVRALGDEVVGDVLVEVLDYGGSFAPIQTEKDARSRSRLAACVTGPRGRFQFNLPPGRYELLSSKPDWNSTSVMVTVDRRRGKQRDIVVPVKVGD